MKRFLFWLTRYFGWLSLAFISTLGGALLVMLFKDWTLKAVLVSLMAWPVLGLAMLAAVPLSLLPLGRLYVYSALGGGLLYNLFLALS
jgi:hypothetical protein